MAIKSIFYYLSLLVKIDCVGCGSLLPTQMGLCIKCNTQLSQYKKDNEQDNEQVKAQDENCISLYSWKPRVSDLVSSYVYFLKSPFSLPAWLEISMEFVNSHTLNGNYKNFLIVPIPSSTGRNHSLYFAKCLSELTNRPYKQVLNYEKSDDSYQSQKQKNISERALQSFVIDEKFTEILSGYHCIIFVDDIITTGATYSAAKRAVRKQLAGIRQHEDMQFFLWTAFKREKSESRC